MNKSIRPLQPLPCIRPKWLGLDSSHRDSLDGIISKRKTLQDCLKFSHFLPGAKLPVILLDDRSLVVLFRLEGIDPTANSVNLQPGELDEHLRSSIESLSIDGARFSLSCLTIRSASRPRELTHRDDAPSLIQFVGCTKQKFWADRFSKCFSHRILCSLRYLPDGNLGTPEAVDLLKQVFDKLREKPVPLKFPEKPLPFKFRKLSQKKSFDELYRLVNFSEPPVYKLDSPLKEQLKADVGIDFDPSGEFFVVNGTEYISILGIKNPPARQFFFLDWRPFDSLGFPLMVWQTIGPAFERYLPTLLRDYPWVAPSFDGHSFTNSGEKEKEKEKEKELAQQLLEQIEGGSELPEWNSWSSFILVRAGDKKTLRARQEEVIRLWNDHSFTCVVEKDFMQAGFIALFPGHDEFYGRQHLVQTSIAAYLLNMYAPHIGDSSADVRSQHPPRDVLGYDPFIPEERVHLRAVCGSSIGKAKFFAMKDLIVCLSVNPMAWVVDLTGSYSDLFALMKEEMPTDTATMRVTPDDSGFFFNPFLLPDGYSGVPKEQFEFCMGLLKILVGPGISGDESEDALREGLKAFFDAYGIILRNRKGEKPIQPLSLLSEILEEKYHYAELAAALRRFTTERWRKIFDSGCDATQGYRCCYFNLQGLDDEPELRAAIVYTILSKVHRAVADESLRTTQKVLMLDEAQRYIADPRLAPAFQRLVNANGRLNVMLDMPDQSIGILESDEIWAKLGQAFVYPGIENIEKTFERLKLDKSTVSTYQKLNPASGEALCWSRGRSPESPPPFTDPYTYWLATTNADELEMKRRMKERFANICDAIKELVRVTECYTTVEERLSKLRAYFKKPTGAFEIGKC
jgi:hypothetical protein